MPTAVIQIIGTTVAKWDVKDVYVGCSGNFTIERSLQNIPGIALHSNDVTIYACALGNYFSGQPLGITFNDEYHGPMEFIREYLKDDASIVTMILLLSQIVTYLNAKPNPYYLRMIDAYKQQWGNLFAETYGKIEKIDPFVKSFYAGDVADYIDNVPFDAGILCYPTVKKVDNEKVYGHIEKILSWTPPQLRIMDQDGIGELMRKAVEHDYFIYGTDHEVHEYDEYLAGMAMPSNRGVPIYIYSKCKERRIALPHQNAKAPELERLGINENIGNDIKIVKLLSEQFNALRSEYLNPFIKPGSESGAYGVVIDGKLIGVFAFSASPTMASWDKHIDTPTIYMMSDFPVAPTKYKRLSKLVVIASLSDEAKLIAQGLMNKRCKSLVTTAFSQNPVSMKYRGLLNQLTKKKLPTVEAGETDISALHYSGGYQLNYGAAIGKWSLKDGLALWKKKYGSELNDREV